MSEVVRYYLDEHVAHAVANGLAQRGVDAITASAANMLQVPDIEHLVFAASQNRTIFSQDADFLRLHAAGHQHAGIVYAHQQTPIGDIVSGLMMIFDVMSAEEMRNHIEFL
jgi:hypothetical protein